MKPIYSIAILLFFLASCSTIKNSVTFEEKKYGLYNSKITSVERDINNPIVGLISHTDSISIYKQTDTVPMKVGYKFGVKFILKSNESKTVEVKTVWVFPKPIFIDGKKYKSYTMMVDANYNEESYAGYFFENEKELMKGKWELKFYLRDKKLYQRNFIMK